MPFAITLGLDAAAAQCVEAMWRTLASRDASDDAVQLGYPPHLTLAVFADESSQARLVAAARGVMARPGLPITLVSLGLFPGTPSALFLAPVVTPALLAMHAEILAAVDGEPIEPHYQCGHWVPHITLAKDLTHPAAAVAALDPLLLPIDGLLDRIEVVRFRPVEILASHQLPVV
jgi:2'-5' RNA ligase